LSGAAVGGESDNRQYHPEKQADKTEPAHHFQAIEAEDKLHFSASFPHCLTQAGVVDYPEESEQAGSAKQEEATQKDFFAAGRHDFNMFTLKSRGST
jgi:hypothetical protein